jgi:hypothetical protein
VDEGKDAEDEWMIWSGMRGNIFVKPVVDVKE